MIIILSEEIMNKMTVLYCRTSTHKQEKGMEAQRRALIEHCSKNNIQDYAIFQDEGVSGTKANRPKLDEMIALVNQGKIENVIVYSFSRMARSTKHLLDILHILQTRNVNFISITESIDTSTAIGQAFFTIISAISQLERELICERVKNGLANAKSKGVALGRPKKRNSKLIQELFKLGYSHRKIAHLAGCGSATVWRELKRNSRPPSPWE